MKYLWLVFVMGCLTPSEKVAFESHPRAIVGGNGGVVLSKFTDTLPRGTVVYCYSTGYKGGVSCVTEAP